MSARSNTFRWAVISLILVIACNCAFAGKTLYVDDDAAGANNGSSWTDAYKYLQDALADANSADKPVKIRVAQGIYRPDRNTAEPNGTGDRTATFQLINAVTLRGAYAGFADTDPNARDIERYETILSGDLAGNDVDVNNLSDLPDELTRAENSYHVVTGSGMDETAVLDGFTITAGNANHSTWHPMVDDPDNRGGGVYNASGSPWVTNCTFRANSAEVEGGGMCNWGVSSPTVTICTVTRNVAMFGGGMYNMSDSSPKLTNCTFSGNWGRNSGGGMMNFRSNLTLTDCTFSKNTGGDGGGMLNFYSRLVLAKCKFSGNTGFLAGGMRNFESSLTLTNCTFIGNSVEHNGGSIYNNDDNKLTLTNCTFIGNSAEGKGGGIYNNADNNLTFTNCTFSGNSASKGNALACESSRQQYPSNLQVSNCILWDGSNGIWNRDGSTIAIRYSDVQSGETVVYDPCDGLIWGEGNIDAEPIFADPGYWDPNGTSDDPYKDFWVDGDYHLKSQAGRWDANERQWMKDDATSSCIDAGDPSSPIANEPFPNGGIVNMGAYGGTAEASKSYFGEPVCETIIAGDINGDCKVDFADFAIMAAHWLEYTAPELRLVSIPGMPSMPNPASIYCHALGYKSKIVTDEEENQYGVCIFPDGSECGSWDFYRGKCGQEWSYCKRNGYDLKDLERYEGWFKGAICIDKNTGEEIGTVFDLVVKKLLSEPVYETIVAGDINGDCKVDFADLAIMVSHWLEDNTLVAVNSNSIVKDGIEYYIETHKAVYHLGEDVEILYRVTNVSENPIDIGRILNCEYAWTHFIITDSNNAEIWEYIRVIPPCGWTMLHLDSDESKEYQKIWNMTNDNGTMTSTDDYPVAPGSYNITGQLRLSNTYSHKKLPVSVDIEIMP